MAHQEGIFEEGAAHHVLLEFEIATPGEARLPGRHLIGTPVEDGSQVVAFGPGALGALAPAELQPFRAYAGQHTAPATQGDLFVWLHGHRRDELFARALEWRDALAPRAGIVREEQGFVFRDSRDLTGFVDGTANPKDDARQEAALVSEPPHAGGSFVLAQRWIHDLPRFGRLPTRDQERVIGRTKADSIELTGDAMRPDSHVSRTDLPGTKIYRRSVPVGGVRDAGLFFLAFSKDPDRFTRLLDSMFGRTSDGMHDRLLGYSRPISGSFYYAPPRAALAEAFEP
ncbi:MAG: Dyp-type peroxidase [Gammaproteobacteria bacterium]|nr:Dyp-type peroxidase [Gammaproteobacteria bacterium]